MLKYIPHVCETSQWSIVETRRSVMQEFASLAVQAAVQGCLRLLKIQGRHKTGYCFV